MCVLCVCVCVSVCLSVSEQSSTEPKGCINLDGVFAIWLFIALAWIFLKSVTKVEGQGHSDSISIISS